MGKCLLFFIGLGLIAFGSYAQRPLTDSRQSSYYTYIYKVSSNDFANFYFHPDKSPDDKIMQHPVDSFKTGRYWDNILAPGNYLKVFADKNKLTYELIENHNAFLKLFANKYDQRFVLVDKQGEEIKAAQVKENGKILLFDDKSKTYHLAKAKKKNIIQADYAGVSNFFIVKEEGYDEDENDGNWFKSTWTSIKKLFEKDENRNFKYAVMRDYTGFMVFNKPKYKPHDTVKFKAFILNEKDKSPVTNKQVLVEQDNDELTLIGKINSYRDGGFAYSFVLNDSLKLKLDERYRILLVDPTVVKGKIGSSRRQGKYDKEGHKVLSNGSFYYEDYELKSIHFKARIDKEEHHRGDKPAIYLKATDENDLPVPDGRVTLTLTSGTSKSYQHVHVFVPDTLWKHQLKLEPIGETKVIIPDSIFPEADVAYEIKAEFLNSSNESQSDRLNGSFKNDRYNIVNTLKGDTLKVTYKDFGKEIKAIAAISALDANGDTLSKAKMALPAGIIINPNAATYNIETDSTSADYDLKNQQPELSISADRTADSLFVNINNPRNLHFWYTVFEGDKVIDAGQAVRLFYSRKYNTNQIITFLVNYIWAGESKFEQATDIVYRNDKLNITVKQPQSVYPGQRVQTDIVVTDVEGKPVANTDITAWSLTRKFENYNTPPIPYIGRSYTSRKLKKDFEKDDVNSVGSIKLNWSRWSREVGLDSIAYYQFTHTKTTYQREEAGVDMLTQIAPFVVNNGDIIPIHLLYIDEKPVYFSQAQQLQQYSFMVTPGLHSLRFRTSHQSIKLDSICVEPYKKLILGLNSSYAPSVKVSDTLGTYEADLINKYMITMVDNYDQKMALLKQNDHVFLLNPYPGNYKTILAGPLTDDFTLFDLQGEKLRSFIAEPGYSFLFEPGLLKQKSIEVKYPFNKVLSTGNGTEDYTQYALTEARANRIWEEYLYNRNHLQELFINKSVTSGAQGKLEVVIHNGNKQYPEIRNIIIYKYDDPDFIRVFAGVDRSFGSLPRGNYRMFFLLKNDSYDIKENISIKPYGLNYYEMQVMPASPADSVSIKIRKVVNGRQGVYNNNDFSIENDALKLKEAFNEKYLNEDIFSETMDGVVLDKNDKQPVVGCSVRIKGTAVGAVTDINGRFKIKVPANGKLIVSYIGYITKEIEVVRGESAKIMIEPNSQSLNEVVVTGYQSQRKSDLTGAVTSVTMLQGQVAGVNVRLRGASGFAAGPGAIYVIDGIIFPNADSIKISSVQNVVVLSAAAAVALLGSQGANGAIIITTKNSTKDNPVINPATSPQQSAEQSIRKNFSDYAYWQPKLTTDENGKASFTTVFPDDITNWRTFIIGINGNRQSGFAENQIKSFKPLSASFLSPLFAVEGDELSALGKISNYNSDAAKLTRTFTYNGKQVKQDNLDVANSKIDTLNLTAANTDSLTFEYTIKRDNGYFDGERRKIPVIKQGVQETVGVFNALNGDTTVIMKFDPAKGPVTLRAEASVLPALMEETQKLRTYKYLCNEQLASKLKGLLMEKRIKKFLGEDFKYEKNINEVIKKLQENRKSQGTWGWWKDSDEELWISLYAIEALVDAQKGGYQIQLDKQKLTDYLVYQMESYKGQDKLVCLELLRRLDAKVDYPKYFGVIERENAQTKEKSHLNIVSNYDKFRLMLLKQEAGQAVKLDSLLEGYHRTMFGNIYWGEDSYRFFDNSVQLTVLAYQIIKNEGKHNNLLPKIQGYFLEQRKTGEWRNTYESALILETILPDVMTSDKQTKPSVLTLTGAKTEMVTKFPYSATITDSQLTVSKTGTLPVYITGYQQFWNTKPEKVSKDFTVDSWFEKKETRLTKLKGGEPVQLKAEVTAKGDADFVMIEIPIPAGCSYESKEQGWQNNEVHREYFKEKVSIFCRKLKQGKYEFTVNLIPRYDGKYTLNPAKAEMMYFPVFYGREGMKRVVIGE